MILKGKAQRKLKGDAQRYGCNSCTRRFINDPTRRSHFPGWVLDRVFDLSVNGLRPKAIINEIVSVSRMLNQEIRMSAQTIRNLISRYVKILLQFELLAIREEPSTRWVIDDAWGRVPTETGRTVLWITNILELGTKCWLVAHVSLGRSKDVTSEAFKLAAKRAKGAPLHIKCDGLKSHIRGIKGSCPGVVIHSKKKKEDFSWINEIESLHSFMRRARISRRGFRSPGNLQDRLNLLRLYYNFLRPHGSLDGETPARVAGISYPRTSSWSELIRFAYSYVNSKRNKRVRRDER